MLTGRFTYGFGRLGQTDDTTALVAPAYSPLETAPAQWGAGEWAMVLGGLYVLYSVTSTTKRGVRRVSGYREERRKRLARQHEASAEHYRS